MLPVRICAGGVGTTGVPTATGQHRDDEVTRTELVGWTRTTIGELRRIAPPEKTAGLRRCEGVCERNKNKS